MNGKNITVVSLGAGDPDLLNGKTLRALRETDCLVLRTGRHGIVHWLEEEQISYTTLDSLYDSAEDFDSLDRAVCEKLFSLDAAAPVYAVTDAVSDHTVRKLLACTPDGVTLSVIPGTGLAELHLAPALSLFSDAPVTASSAYVLLGGCPCDPNRNLLITELDNPILTGEIKIFLSSFLEDEHPVYLIHGGSAPEKIQLFEIDRRDDIDHLTALFVPGSDYLSRRRFVLNDLTALMDRLRSPDGCPWDSVQTHHSLRPYLVEEAWECVDSIDREDPDHLCEELGDLLFQIVFHSSVGRSFGEFSIHDVITAITGKMIRRHPHVFGDLALKDRESVKATWEGIKQKETGHTTVAGSLDDVSAGLPSLKYTAKMFKKLSQAPAFERTAEEVLSDLRSLVDDPDADSGRLEEDSLERLLLLCAELCWRNGADSELLLHRAADRLKNRMKKVEKTLAREGKSLELLTFSELGVYLKHVEGEIE